MEFHRQLLHQHHLQCHLHCGNDPTVANHNGIPSATHPPAPLAIPFTLRERPTVANHNGILSTAHARKTVETPFTMRNRSEHDPRMIRPHTRPSRTRRTAKVDHRRSGTDFVWKHTGFRASAISQKRISCKTSSKPPSATPPPAPLAMPFALRERSYSCKSQWNSICNSSTSTTCNPICIAGTILQLQSTMEFHLQLIHQHHLQSHLHCGNDPTVANHNGILSTAHARKTLETPFTMRNRSEHDPRMIRPHTRPSRTRRTAKVDHRRSGTDFVWKNTGFRASAISQKRISCKTSSKTPSATPPPAPLAMPFALWERSYSCKSQWNSICNSSTSTTCNPICIAGTILQLQITMEFHLQLIHQHHLQSHLHCGNDPTVANHNGIPSATHPPAPLAIPFALRERSYSCKSQWNSICNSSTSTTCNPICIAGTILQLQITMEFCRPHMHEKHLKPHLQCGTDPSMIRE